MPCQHIPCLFYAYSIQVIITRHDLYTLSTRAWRAVVDQVTSAKSARDYAQKLRRDLKKEEDPARQRELQAELEQAQQRADQLRLSAVHPPGRRPEQLGSQIDVDLTFNSMRQGSTI